MKDSYLPGCFCLQIDVVDHLVRQWFKVWKSLSGNGHDKRQCSDKTLFRHDADRDAIKLCTTTKIECIYHAFVRFSLEF